MFNRGLHEAGRSQVSEFKPDFNTMYISIKWTNYKDI